MKRDITRMGILFAIGVVIMVAAKIAKSAIGVFGLVLTLAAIFFETFLLWVRIPKHTKALERQMKKVLVTEELFELFDNEMMGTPNEMIEITGGRVVFTGHFVMSQYETPGMNRFSRILLWDKMDEMDTTVYKSNGQTNGIVTRFYKPGEKKCCQAIEFKVAKDTDKFWAKLTELKTDIRVR